MSVLWAHDPHSLLLSPASLLPFVLLNSSLILCISIKWQTVAHKCLLQHYSWWLSKKPPQVSVSRSLLTTLEIMLWKSHVAQLFYHLYSLYVLVLISCSHEYSSALTCVHRGKRRISGVLLFHFASYSLETQSHWSWSLDGCQKAQTTFYLCSGVTTEHLTTLSFLCECSGFELRSSYCATRALSH